MRAYGPAVDMITLVLAATASMEALSVMKESIL